MVELETIIQNEYISFIIILIGTIISIALAYFILKFYVNKIAGGKKTLSKYILKKLSIPLLALVFIAGLYTATKILTILGQYQQLIDGVFFIVTTFVIAVVITRISNVLLMGWLKSRRGFKRTPGLIDKVITLIIFILALFVILDYFEVDITPLIAGLGVGALAIGLALQSTLSNFFAGVHLLSDRPIGVGDFIELDKDTMGFIEDIGWRSTRIKTLKNNLLIIPNNKLAESNILNYSMPDTKVGLWIECGVAYGSDLKKVEKITLEVAREIQKTSDGAVRDYEPLFRFREFGDSNINFLAILMAEDPLKRYPLRNEFIKALKERFNKEEIEISWPIRKIYRVK